MTLTDLQPYLDLALDLLPVARAEILPRFRRTATELKGDGTPVTEADRAAERAMRAVLRDKLPTHRITGEEYGSDGPADARHEWLLDPVDGTAWFTLGIPVFGTLVALLEDGEPILGVIDFPAMDETVYAARGLGCWHRVGDEAPVRVQVAPVATLADAYVSCSGAHGSDLTTGPYALSRVVRGAGKFRFVADCLQHGMVCRGVLHAAIDPIMAPWDSAALVACVREAGGVAAALDGTRTRVAHAGSLVTAASEALLQEILAAVGGVTRPTESVA
jgi:histidinol-phosphatase